MKLILKNEIEIALTSDKWTSNVQTKYYYSFNAHYINQEFVLRINNLATIKHSEFVNANLFINCFQQVIDEFLISTKLMSITTDNAFVMIVYKV